MRDVVLLILVVLSVPACSAMLGPRIRPTIWTSAITQTVTEFEFASSRGSVPKMTRAD